MSVPLRPLPDHDPLKVAEVAAALGCAERAVQEHLARGRFPGAFRTLTGVAGRGRWRIPRADVIEVGRQLGVWP
jgi:predicted ArsR family transcriptional regulator